MYNSTLSTGDKTDAPPMVFISGEEMTHYAMNLVVEKWVDPYFDTNKWERFDLSCKSRDESNDQVLADAVEAGKRVGAIFKGNVMKWIHDIAYGFMVLISLIHLTTFDLCIFQQNQLLLHLHFR